MSAAIGYGYIIDTDGIESKWLHENFNFVIEHSRQISFDKSFFGWIIADLGHIDTERGDLESIEERVISIPSIEFYSADPQIWSLKKQIDEKGYKLNDILHEFQPPRFYLFEY